MPFLGIPPGRLGLSFEKDGVRVGCEYSSAGVSTSMLLSDGSDSLMIEAGDGSLRDLLDQARARTSDPTSPHAAAIVGVLIEGLSGILLSHSHFDHSTGLLAILYFMDMLGRRSPMTLVYPEGDTMVPRMVDLVRSDRKGQLTFELVLHPVHDGSEIDMKGWSVTVLRSFHKDVGIDGKMGGVVPSCSYIVRRRGMKILYSGDTAINDHLVEAAKGCDLAIAEATYPADGYNPVGAHMTVREALRVVSEAERGWIVHLTGASLMALEEYGVHGCITTGSKVGTP